MGDEESEARFVKQYAEEGEDRGAVEETLGGADECKQERETIYLHFCKR